MTPAERHLINRLVASFATGDSIVGNNLVLNLYKHINSPGARMYLSRQLFEEAQHVEFYLTLLDSYISNLKSGRTLSMPWKTSNPSGGRRSSAFGGLIRSIR
jgi:ribonucleotide reductase beta subunit family protein with ferritin-like domain